MNFQNLTSNPWMIVFIIILILNNIQSYINNPSALAGLLLSIPGILIAITFHEYAHAWMADKLGDDTPRRQGRLTLNPIAHMDLVGAILLITAGFGWGKPVEINSNQFNRKISIKKGNALVALAGPVMNLILAVIFSIIYGLLIKFASGFVLTTVGSIILGFIQYAIAMNVGLGVFNLIPLPPLDGSKILLGVLPKRASIWFESNEKILYIIFVILWITPFASMIISPAVNAINNGLLKLIIFIAK